MQQPQDEPIHNPNIESLMGTQGWLGNELCRALSMFPEYAGKVEKWQATFAATPRTVEGSESLWAILDTLHALVAGLQSRDLDGYQQEIVKDVLDSWEQVSQHDDQTPFGAFD
jgi:hypothetical protein